MVRFFLFFAGIVMLSGRPAEAVPRLALRFDPPPLEVYVGQEAFFHVRLLDRIGINGIAVMPADWPNVDVFAWEKKFGSAVAEDGTSYILHDMLFSMVPKVSGEMIFPSFCLVLHVPTMVSDRDLPDTVRFLSDGRIEICTPRVQMTVEKLPPSSSPLFAASEVKLFDGVEPKVSSVREGTPVKRSVLLSAKGTLPAFLPDFTIEEIENSRIYKGKTERTSPSGQKGVSAALRQTIVIVPKKAGKIVLPEIKVPWFNTRTGQTETAVVPAYPLIVLPASDAVADENEPEIVPEQKEKTPVRSKTFQELIVLPVFFLPVWLFFKTAGKRKAQKEAVNAVRTACLNNDFEQASQAILAWAVNVFPEVSVKNLSDVRAEFREKSPAFVQQLEKLEQYLYGTGRFAKHIPSAKESLGKDLFASFQQAAQIKFPKRKKKKSKLPALYPDDDGF